MLHHNIYKWYTLLYMKKKLSIFITIFVLVFGIQFSQTKNAFAVVPVIEDGVNLFTNTVTTSENVWQGSKDTVLIPLMTSIADRMLTKMSSDVISWANGGHDGDTSFIKNWDNFLKGTEHAVILGSFDYASKKASEIQNNADIQNQTNISSCLAKITEEAGSQAECENYYPYIDDFNRCINALHINDPSYDDDYYDCETRRASDQVSLDACIAGIPAYNIAAQACNTQQADQTGQILGSIAQQNFDNYQSGEQFNVRSAAKTIANFGLKTNIDETTALIDGDGNTLKKLLGTQQKVNQFKNDITVGGWSGYIAFGDPHNYSSGTQSLIENALGEKTTSKISSVIQDIQTPQKLLDKKSCSGGGKAVKGKCPEGELLITETPGQQVTAKLNKALLSDEKKASLFSGQLVGSLIKAVGKLTDNLITVGVSKLTSAAATSFFKPQDNQVFTSAGGSANYQSEYDVLGIANDTTTSPTNEIVTHTDGNPIVNNNNDSQNTAFLGGPDDQGIGWNTGTQIIINLKEDLEKNIKLATEELSYFNQIDVSLETYKNTAINLDRCIPGPDYNWEQRYKDQWSTFGSGDGNALNNIGFSETKEMYDDPLVNIPGSLQMRDTFSSIIKTTGQESQKLKQRKNTVTNVVRVLNSIRDDITSQFNNLMLSNTSIVAPLVLYSSEWDILTTQQQIQALTQAEQGFTKSDGSLSGGYFILKENETIAGVIETENTRAKEAVLSLAWDIWRDKTDKEKKQNLRYNYYILENDLSNKQFVAQARANLYRINNGGEQSKKLLNDCLILKAYTLGTDVSDLTTVTSNNTSSVVGQAAITIGLYTLNPALGIINGVGSLFGGGGLFGPSGQSFTFIPLGNARSDAEIKTFLETQYNLYNSGSSEALFQTDILTRPSALQNSLLGFDDSQTQTVNVQTSTGTETDLPDYAEMTLPETEAYFQSKYPDYGFKDEIKNVYDLKNLYKYDRFYSGFNRARGVRGTLFCRNSRVFDAIDGTPDNSRSICIKNWYIASNLDYETVFSGI